jgi:hypothetical protein
MRLPASLIAIVSAALMIGAAPALLAQSQSFDGTYKGSLECEQISGGAEHLRTPLAMSIRNGHVIAFMPLSNLHGRTEISFLPASGTVQAGGILRLVTWVYTPPDDVFVIDFSGTLDADGGTLAGVQLLSLPVAGKASRTCEGTFTKVETQNR